MSFDSVTVFENTIASYYNAPYAVATDCCTHALELSLRYLQPAKAICPSRTYLSVPMTFKKLGISYGFDRSKWKDYYYITDKIIDAAVYWKQGGYVSNTFMCLSFQYKKHLNLGRGGMILLDNREHAENLRMMSYDGRLRNVPWAEQDVTNMGYHYYMTPETATMGLEKFPEAERRSPRLCTQDDYPDLTTFSIFKDDHDKSK